MQRLSIGELKQRESLILIGRREKGHEGRDPQTKELESGQSGEMAGRGEERREGEVKKIE